MFTIVSNLESIKMICIRYADRIGRCLGKSDVSLHPRAGRSHLPYIYAGIKYTDAPERYVVFDKL